MKLEVGGTGNREQETQQPFPVPCSLFPSLRLSLRLKLVVALLLALLAAGVGVHSVRAETLTLEEYHARVAAALAALEAADDPEATLALLVDDLAAIDAVRLPSGELLTLSESLLGGRQLSVEAALARLRVVEEQMRLSANDDLAARQSMLAAILNRREFRASESLVERLLRRLRAWWESLFPQRPQTTTTDQVDAAAFGVVEWVVAVVGGGALLALLVWWLRRFIAGFVGDAELRRRLAAGEEIPLTAAEARAQAAEQARAGSFREAVRSLYLAALLSLEEREIVVNDRTLTNRELLARAAREPTLREHMAPVVSTFDEVWYGVREPDAATFTAYEREVDALNTLPARAPEEKP